MEIAFSLKRHASNYSTLHHSDIAARAAPLNPRLIKPCVIYGFTNGEEFHKELFSNYSGEDMFLRILRRF